ncbi:MAG: hypothetical protein HY280_01930 [Nitrospinae bacterium]|nr:hypothetical protein [Nitrospinota bacterium]
MGFEQIFGKTYGEPDADGRAKVRKVLDDLIAYASEERFQAKLDEARAYYFFKAGKTNDDDKQFIQRMNTFLEWFVFDYRPEGAGGKSLFDHYLAEKLPSLSAENLVLRIAASKNYHSIFRVKSSGNGVLVLKDLAGKNSYLVTDDDTLEPKDILETRVITLGKGCFITSTYCLHPKQALKQIKSEIKKRKGAALDEDFFFKLQGMQLKWRRFRQISIDDIYRM